MAANQPHVVLATLEVTSAWKFSSSEHAWVDKGSRNTVLAMALQANSDKSLQCVLRDLPTGRVIFNAPVLAGGVDLRPPPAAASGSIPENAWMLISKDFSNDLDGTDPSSYIFCFKSKEDSTIFFNFWQLGIEMKQPPALTTGACESPALNAGDENETVAKDNNDSGSSGGDKEAPNCDEDKKSEDTDDEEDDETTYNEEGEVEGKESEDTDDEEDDETTDNEEGTVEEGEVSDIENDDFDFGGTQDMLALSAELGSVYLKL